MLLGTFSLRIARKHFLVLTLLVVAGSATAATFSRHCFRLAAGDELRCGILLQGEISPGDTERLRHFASRPENEDLARRKVLVLRSPGGNVEEAIKLATLMRNTFGAATVLPGDVCASACFLLWIGSPTHSTPGIPGKARIGLHRPYFSDAAYATASAAALAGAQAAAIGKVRQFLQEQNLSQRLTDEMMRRASNNIYWLTAEDTFEIGSHAPWVEEILVRRCNYKNAQFLAADARLKAGTSTNADFTRHIEPVSRCVGEVLREKRAEVSFAS